jgi:hypothetical protein
LNFARGQCYIAFLSVIFFIFVPSCSVCYNRLEKLAKDKHSSLLQTFVNCEQKGFITLAPDCVSIVYHCVPSFLLIEGVDLRLDSMLSSVSIYTVSRMCNKLDQGTLTERESSVQLTSLIWLLVLYEEK